MKLLVVEDEPTANAFLAKGLREEGYSVDTAHTSSEADTRLAVYSYDAILLDVMIPGEDGFTLCRKWRDAGIGAPVLFLTARGEIGDRVRAFDLGGDDYLVKPYSFDELLARLRRLLRRHGESQASAEMRFGDLRIDTAGQRVFRGDQEIKLTAREYQILAYFAHHPRRLISRTVLWEHIWDSYSEPDSNVVDVYVGYLRNKLGRSPNLIETRRGQGYVFSPPEGD